MSHANARLTVHGRRLLVQRVLAGHRVGDVARQMGCARATAYKWLARYRTEGEAGLHDRPSRPARCPHRTDPATEQRILDARRVHRRGANRLADELGLCPSTVGRVLARHRTPRLSECDALTGAPVRQVPHSSVRYERARPGELIHIDIKKLGRIPEGGGWRAHGRGLSATLPGGQGYEFVHAAVDDRSRLAYAEILDHDTGIACAQFFERAVAFFAQAGIARIERVMTDNALCYIRAQAFADVLAAAGARHVPIKPRCPWTNGKVERFIRTLQREWAYARVYLSNTQRALALPDWLDYYNTRRRHSALGGRPPTSRLSTT